jgi:hypothetical protein
MSGPLEFNSSGWCGSLLSQKRSYVRLALGMSRSTQTRFCTLRPAPEKSSYHAQSITGSRELWQTAQDGLTTSR